MTRQVLLAPSLLSADLLHVSRSIESLEGEYDWLHVDVMDGTFVPNITFGPAFVAALRKGYPDALLDVHLMVDRPDRILDLFLDAGPDILTVHVEADIHIHRTLSRIRERGVRAGITLNPGTSEELIRPLLPFIDHILVMSVNPGFGGQIFIEPVLEKTRQLCRWRTAGHYSWPIAMDGGLGLENAGRIALAGCDVLVMGSAVFSAPEPAEFLREIRRRVKEAMTCA